MRIDELPYHSSFFYQLIFFFKEAVFHKHWKIPLKMQKVRNDPLLDKKILKGEHFFLNKDDFLKTCTFTRTFISF